MGIIYRFVDPYYVVQGTPSAGGVTHTNEPVGFTQRGEEDFANALDGVNWSSQNQNGSTFELGTDANAVLSPGGIGKIIYASPYTGGSDPARVFTPMPATNEVYMHFGFYLSADWVPHPNSGVNKMIFLTDDDTSGGGDPYYFCAFGTSFPLEFQFRLQGDPPAAANYGRNQGSAGDADIDADTWVEIEVHLVVNTPGSSDGEVHIWMNGTKTHQYTGLDGVVSGSDGNVDSLRLEPTWGGLGGSYAQGMYQAYSYFYISTP